MTRARVLQEVRQRRFEELYERRQQRILTMAEAGEMLGVTKRTFRRWSGRYHAEGQQGPFLVMRTDLLSCAHRASMPDGGLLRHGLCFTPGSRIARPAHTW